MLCIAHIIFTFSDNLCFHFQRTPNFYTPPHVCGGGGVCFHVGVHVSVRPSVVCTCMSIRTLFPFDNLSIYKQISFIFCICICTNNVSLGTVNGQISIIYHRVMVLVNVQKMVFGLYSAGNLQN